MSEITFKAKIRRIGTSFCVTIPAGIVKNMLIPMKEYIFIIKELENQ